MERKGWANALGVVHTRRIMSSDWWWEGRYEGRPRYLLSFLLHRLPRRRNILRARFPDFFWGGDKTISIARDDSIESCRLIGG